MLSLILIAAIGQYQAKSPAIAAPTIDLAFERATEEFAVACAPRLAPPEPYRSLIAGLGSPRWADRDAASKALHAAVLADAGGRRWLWHGRLIRNPEVRLRANAIVRRLSPCPACRGSGASRAWSKWPCWDCGGLGHCWPYASWD